MFYHVTPDPTMSTSNTSSIYHTPFFPPASQTSRRLESMEDQLRSLEGMAQRASAASAGL